MNTKFNFTDGRSAKFMVTTINLKTNSRFIHYFADWNSVNDYLKFYNSDCGYKNIVNIKRNKTWNKMTVYFV